MARPYRLNCALYLMLVLPALLASADAGQDEEAFFEFLAAWSGEDEAWLDEELGREPAALDRQTNNEDEYLGKGQNKAAASSDRGIENDE